jgi:hypothetical protein
VADGIRIEGVPALVRALEGLGDDLGDLRTAHENIAAQGAAAASRYAPRRTGRLGRSIRASTTPNRAVVGAGNASVGYSGFVDYGTRFMAAEPFMSRADRVMGEIADREIDKNINSVIRRNGLA